MWRRFAAVQAGSLVGVGATAMRCQIAWISGSSSTAQAGCGGCAGVFTDLTSGWQSFFRASAHTPPRSVRCSGIMMPDSPDYLEQTYFLAIARQTGRSARIVPATTDVVCWSKQEVLLASFFTWLGPRRKWGLAAEAASQLLTQCQRNVLTLQRSIQTHS